MYISFQLSVPHTCSYREISPLSIRLIPLPTYMYVLLVVSYQYYCTSAQSHAG